MGEVLHVVVQVTFNSVDLKNIVLKKGSKELGAYDPKGAERNFGLRLLSSAVNRFENSRTTTAKPARITDTPNTNSACYVRST